MPSRIIRRFSCACWRPNGPRALDGRGRRGVWARRSTGPASPMSPSPARRRPQKAAPPRDDVTGRISLPPDPAAEAAATRTLAEIAALSRAPFRRILSRYVEAAPGLEALATQADKSPTGGPRASPSPAASPATPRSSRSRARSTSTTCTTCRTSSSSCTFTSWRGSSRPSITRHGPCRRRRTDRPHEPPRERAYRRPR
jgi:hypothetical protein